MKIRALDPDDATTLVALRREALSTSPLTFGASLEDDRGLSLESVRSSLANVATFVVLGTFEGEALVGMVGIIRLEKLQSRHKAMIWGMFVTPPARRRGLGSALLVRRPLGCIGAPDSENGGKSLERSSGKGALWPSTTSSLT